jgi:hypothetical protein
MAYTVTDLATAQAKLTAAFASSELRADDNATFKAYLLNSEIMFPGYRELKTSDTRGINAYFKNRSTRSLGSSREHDHTGTQGTSGVLAPSWVSYADDFAISLKQGDTNVFNHAEQLQNEVDNVYLNFNTGLEQAAVDHLFANRSGVNGITVEGTFNGTKDAFEVTDATNGDRFVQIVKSTMQALNYKGITLFCDTIAFNKFEKEAAQGAQNSTNLSFQFGGVKYVHSLGLNAEASTLVYSKGFCIAVPDGTIAALPWIPVQNRAGVVTSVDTFTSAISPFDGQSYAVHMYETRVDGVATGGQKQDVMSEFEFSIDVAFENAPLSNAGESTLQAFALI